MFILMCNNLGHRSPVGSYKSKYIAAMAAKYLNNDTNNDYFFYVQEVLLDGYDLSKVL